jgi:uncharacterized membrane protein (Fun14 family)
MYISVVMNRAFEFMSIENFSSYAATIGGGFFAGILIGYAIKKVVKVAAIVVGLFFAGLVYLEYQQIVAINWNKVPHLSHNVVTTLANATTQIPGFNSSHPADISISNFGIPLAGSMSVGFAIGFMKG